MPGAVRDHLRHNVVGYLALFLVLGGTAAALPGKNTVNSGDIKPKAVHASDIARKAVTAAKIAPRSVDGWRVIDNSLTGDDIDESTLNLRTAPNSIGPTELADRSRRLIFGPTALLPGGTGAPDLVTSAAFPALAFHDEPLGHASFVTDIPGGRVEGTRLTVRVLWSPDGDGGVTWSLGYAAGALGQDITATKVATLDATTDAASGRLAATSFEIPGGAVQNGMLLGLTLERATNDAGDNLGGDAFVHMIEIDYTATG